MFNQKTKEQIAQEEKRIRDACYDVQILTRNKDSHAISIEKMQHQINALMDHLNFEFKEQKFIVIKK